MKFIFFVVFICSLFGGCNVGLEYKVYNNISEMVDFVVVGADDNLSASLMCGRREVDYQINGISSELIPYGILTLSFSNNIKSFTQVDYVLFVGTKKFQGKMQKEPYNDTWVVDIKSVVDKNENISVSIFVDNETYSLKLKSIDEDWTLTPNAVVDVLIKEYKNELNKMVVDGVLEGEVYIKIISEQIVSNHYYYCVSVVDRKGGSFNFLLSPVTKEILASNNTIV